MNTKVNFLILAFFGIFGISGCETFNAMLATAPKPEVSFRNLSVKDIKTDSAELLAELEVSNPYAVPLLAEGIGFALASGESPILSGATEDGFRVPAGSSASVPVAVTLPYSDVMKAVSGVRLGQVLPYTLDLDVDVTGQGIAPLGFDLQKSGEVPVPNVPEVKVKGVEWEDLSLAGARGNVGLSLKNTNEFPMTLAAMEYALSLSGYDVSEGSLATEVLELAPGESGDLNLGFAVRPQDLGFAAFRALSGGDADFRLKGLVDTKTPFGPMKLDFDREGRTVLRK